MYCCCDRFWGRSIDGCYDGNLWSGGGGRRFIRKCRAAVLDYKAKYKGTKSAKNRDRKSKGTRYKISEIATETFFAAPQ